MKNSHRLFSVIVSIFILLSACSPVTVRVQPSPIFTTNNNPEATSTLKPTIAPTLTTIHLTATIEREKTPFPTWPPLLTANITPTREIHPTSDFENVPAVIYTPSAPANCPKSSQTHLAMPETWAETEGGFQKVILEILNDGGIDQLLIHLKNYQHFFYAYEDLTHDGIRELVINTPRFGGNLNVFGCTSGEFVNLLTISPVYEYTPGILATKDLNRDGVKELAVTMLTCHYCTGIKVFEWNGASFDSIVETRCGYDYDVLYCSDSAEMNGYSTASIEDIDKNGTDELVLEGGIPSWLGGLSGNEGPYRGQRAVYMWDGKHFAFYSHKNDPPNFRYEAIQDGDFAMINGDYDAALSSYQAAIFDEKLKSWDENAWKKLLSEIEGIGYPDIQKMPFKQIEYDQLSAYARYRIVLLHLKQGWDADAKLVYDTLQEKYLVGNPGHSYAEMAADLWIEYQNTRSLSAACQKAIEYAKANTEILSPLGMHGSFDTSYVPESVCPFYFEHP